MNSDTPERPAAPPASPNYVNRARLEGYFRGAALLVLLLLGAVATLRGYAALERAILVWLRPQWVPVAQVAFSFAIVALCVWLIRSWVIARSE